MFFSLVFCLLWASTLLVVADCTVTVVTRMPDDCLTKKTLYGELQVGKHFHGGQKKRYKDTLKASLKDFNTAIESWEQIAQDRTKWRGLIRRGADDFFFFFFFFDLGFTALSRIFHLYRADRSSKVGENRRTRRKTTWPSVSRTWLSHIWPERGSNHSGEKPNGLRVNSLIH